MSATVGRPPAARVTGVVSGLAMATAAFGVALIAGIWITIPARVALERQEALDSEAATNANLVLALEEQTNQRLRALDQFLLLMRHQYEQPPPRVPFSALVAPAFADTSGITLIAALDEHGDVIESMTPGPGMNAADRPMFRFHQQDPSRDLAIGAPILGRISGKWVITLTRRVNRPDGSFGGVVDISVEPSYLTALYEKTALGPDDIMSQVLENGLTLSRRHGGTASFGEDVSDSALMREYGRQPVGAYIGRGALDGHLRLFSYRRLTDYPVIAVVGRSQAAALAPANRRARTYYTMAALVSVAIAAVCAAGVWMSARQQRSNRRLTEQAWLLDEAQDAIVVSGLDRRITYWNRSAERLYGWPAAEALGRTMADLLYAGDPAFIEAALAAVGQSGAWLGELHPVARNGRRVVAESRWTLVRDAAGAPLSILTIDSDVTERRQFEQQSYRAQRLESLGTLAGGIAHDLNNVLTPILLGAEILLETATDDDTRELAQQIGDSARRGADMVGQVLSFARGQEGRRCEVPVLPLIEDVARIARDTLPKNIVIVTDVAPALPPVHGDATQFHQVLLNLCVNARDAMPHGGRLVLSAHALAPPATSDAFPGAVSAGPQVVLQVEDTGEGMTAALIERIFDPFFTTKAPGKGTGLGLSTSLTIVRKHGGHVTVDSTPGQGSRFRIYLPVHVDAPAAPPPAAAERRANLGHGETILVVDDEPEIRMLTRTLLERAGYHVRVAADGAAGLREYDTHRAEIAAVITDVMMPVAGGDELVRALVQRNPDVRIVVVSGIPGNEGVIDAAPSGAAVFLAKPFTGAALLQALHDLLSPRAGPPPAANATGDARG